MGLFNMSYSKNRLTPVAAGILIALNSGISSADIVLNFSNSTVAGVQGTDFNYTVCTGVTDKAGTEFRMCDPGNTSLGGGIPLKKDSINGSESWTFTDAGVMTAVTNTSLTGGLSATSISYGITGASTTGGPGIDQGANFFGSAFGFLAPTLGSEAGNYYGTATISISQSGLTIDAPVMEAQWGGTYFPLGQDGSAGVTFYGDVSNIVLGGGGAGIASFDYKMYAEHTITINEDPGAAGFTSWTAQWYYVGSGTAPDTVFGNPQSPVATPNTLVVTAGTTAAGNVYGDGRALLADIVADYPADTGTDLPNGITNLCSGDCFDFTVTGVAGDAIVILPLSAPIPSDPVYRKYNATDGWHNFDTSGTDTIESGPDMAAGGLPTDCTGTTWSADLTPGDKCVRLTIADDGPNDSSAIVGTVIDPSGVAAAPPAVADNTIAAQPLPSGCSISSTPTQASNYADWWIVAAFLTLLGIRKKKGQHQA